MELFEKLGEKAYRIRKMLQKRGNSLNLIYNDLTNPQDPEDPEDPTPDVTITGLKRNKFVDGVRWDRWEGLVSWPGTTQIQNEIRAEITAGKNTFMAQKGGNIYKYAGPHITPPASPTVTLYDTTSGKNNSGQSANIINGTPTQTTIPLAAKTFLGDFQGGEELGYAASWCYYNKRDVSKAGEISQVKQAIKDVLLFLASRPGLDFTNRKRYNAGSFQNSDLPPGFGIEIMVIKCAKCFDYIADICSVSERKALIKWFQDWADFSLILQDGPFSELFTASTVRNGNVANYTISTGYSTMGGSEPTIWGKPNSPRTAKRYNNRRQAGQLIYAILGFFKSHPELYGEFTASKNWYDEAYTLHMEQLAYCMFPVTVGIDGEENRNEDDKTSQGLNYFYTRIGFVCDSIGIALMDGQTRFATAATTAGANGTQVTGGGPAKTIKSILEEISKRMRGAVTLYGVTFDPNTLEDTVQSNGTVISANTIRPWLVSDLDGQVTGIKDSNGQFVRKNGRIQYTKKVEWKSYVDLTASTAEDIFNSDTLTGQFERKAELGYRAFVPLAQNPVGTGGNRYWTGSFGTVIGSVFLDELGMRQHRLKRYPALTGLTIT